ncbi:MAG: DUF72 domain-containing protein [Syntrophales bacterium]|nr:DUF72 domain-containing protein [Syntrophales bacterium]
MKVLVGTAGWSYGHWEGVFYPVGLPVKARLSHYAQHFATVEVNASFYRLPAVPTFLAWREQTPAGFVMAVKANRYLTHVKRLQAPAEPLARLFQAARALGDKLGPVLFQLPPSLAFDGPLLADFCAALRGYNHRCAWEVRHASWLCEAAYTILADHGLALCIADTAGRYPYSEVLTTDFVYVRLHGGEVLYKSCYTEGELQAWAEKIRYWNRDAYVYFDNDYGGYAVENAVRLRELLACEGLC